MNAATTICAPDAHDWQPISGWYARYRCSICGVIGGKPGAIQPQRGRTAIEPYRCEAKRGGERCTEPAVHAWRGRNLRCAAHRHPGRTAGARKQIGAAGDSVSALPVPCPASTTPETSK
jgi:hypothetical protein